MWGLNKVTRGLVDSLQPVVVGGCFTFLGDSSEVGFFAYFSGVNPIEICHVDLKSCYLTASNDGSHVT